MDSQYNDLRSQISGLTQGFKTKLHQTARLRRDLRTQDGKIDGLRKDVNNLAKVQPSENIIANMQHQIEILDRSCNAIIKLLPDR